MPKKPKTPKTTPEPSLKKHAREYASGRFNMFLRGSDPMRRAELSRIEAQMVAEHRTGKPQTKASPFARVTLHGGIETLKKPMKGAILNDPKEAREYAKENPEKWLKFLKGAEERLNAANEFHSSAIKNIRDPTVTGVHKEHRNSNVARLRLMKRWAK